MQNELQLSAEMEKRFDDRFTYKDEKMNHPRPEVCNGLMWGDVKHFLATALEEQRKKYLLAVEMLPETFEVENDGELLEVRKGVFDFKEEVLSILNGKE